tara:strand:+ start:75 stop:215 length:141 start_codon:yes stop_codon:yes gene_type:complete
MQEHYKYSLLGITKIVGGLAVGIAVGWVFTSALQLFLDIINLDKLL